MQLIVLGMHRSGTSVLARILNLMGVYFGPEGISTGANKENPKGFWERRDVRELNDRVLHAAGCDWNRIAGFDLQSLSDEVLQEFHVRASKLVLEMDAHRPWFIKEPRLCLLLPLWRKLLEVPVCIHIHRHPVEVAASLHTRNGIPIPVGMALWEKYESSAAQAAADLPSVMVFHRDLMTKPMDVVEHLHRELVARDVPGLRMPSAREVAAFLDPALYRERSSRKDLRHFARKPQVQLFRALEKDPSQALLDPGYQPAEDLMEALRSYESGLPPMQLNAPGAKTPDPTVALREQIATRDQEIRQLREAVASRDLTLKLQEQQKSLANEELRDLVEKVRELTEQRNLELVRIGELQAKTGLYEQELARRDQDATIIGKLQATVELYEREINKRAGRISQQDDMLREFQRTVERQCSEVEDREEQVEQLGAELRASHDRVAGLQQSLETSRARESSLQKQIAARDRSLQEANGALTRNSARTAEIEGSLRKAEQDLETSRARESSLQKQIAARDRSLQEANGALTRNSARTVEIEGSLRRAEQELETRFREIAQVSRMLFDLEKSSRTQLATREGELAAVRESLEAMCNSRLWRLMAPLRALGRMRGQSRKGGITDMGSAVVAIEDCGLFDRAWYFDANPDVVASGMDPVVHYLCFGAAEGRNPGPAFDTTSYLDQNPDVKDAGMNPLLHYALYGRQEGRWPEQPQTQESTAGIAK